MSERFRMFPECGKTFLKITKKNLPPIGFEPQTSRLSGERVNQLRLADDNVECLKLNEKGTRYTHTHEKISIIYLIN